MVSYAGGSHRESYLEGSGMAMARDTAKELAGDDATNSADHSMLRATRPYRDGCRYDSKEFTVSKKMPIPSIVIETLLTWIGLFSWARRSRCLLYTSDAADE